MKRQHYQHIAMEPEWEMLFNVCILLLEAIEQVVEWCQSDVSVCVHAPICLSLYAPFLCVSVCLCLVCVSICPSVCLCVVSVCACVSVCLWYAHLSVCNNYSFKYTCRVLYYIRRSGLLLSR